MKKLLIILSIMVSTNAFAGILLEPYVGYNTGKGEDNTSKSDITGMGYGARVGWTMPLVFVALDYSMGGLEEEDTTTTEVDQTLLGVVVGASLPVIRVWAGYNFSAELDYDVPVIAGVLEGTGMKVGLGFKLPLLPVSFNAEYLINTYDELDGADMGANEFETKMLFISVSAPFDL